MEHCCMAGGLSTLPKEASGEHFYSEKDTLNDQQL